MLLKFNFLVPPQIINFDGGIPVSRGTVKQTNPVNAMVVFHTFWALKPPFDKSVSLGRLIDFIWATLHLLFQFIQVMPFSQCYLVNLMIAMKSEYWGGKLRQCCSMISKCSEEHLCDRCHGNASANMWCICANEGKTPQYAFARQPNSIFELTQINLDRLNQTIDTQDKCQP